MQHTYIHTPSLRLHQVFSSLLLLLLIVTRPNCYPKERDLLHIPFSLVLFLFFFLHIMGGSVALNILPPFVLGLEKSSGGLKTMDGYVDEASDENNDGS